MCFFADRSYYGPTNATTGHVTADDIGCVVSGASCGPGLFADCLLILSMFRAAAWQTAATRAWVAGNFAWTGAPDTNG